MLCEICGRKHATWEHKVFDKLRLAETGMPLKRLFVIIGSGEEQSDDPYKDQDPPINRDNRNN